jgi:hypothetical protein
MSALDRPFAFLPSNFRIRVARTAVDFELASSLRGPAYARRHPGLSEVLESPEDSDMSPDTIVFIAEDKSSGTVYGTIRLEGNSNQSLEEELNESCAPHMPKGRIFRIGRLVVLPFENSSMIKFCLFKAVYLASQALQGQWLIVTALPPMDAHFCDVLGFSRLLPADGTFDDPYYPGRRILLLGLHIPTAPQVLHKKNLSTHDFFVNTYSPEIQIFDSVIHTVYKRRRVIDTEIAVHSPVPALV